jgi:hypothetical protein
LSTTFLRTARKRYSCDECGAHIRLGQFYFREEPGKFSRMRGVPPIYRCTVCVTGIEPWQVAEQRAKATDNQQLYLWSAEPCLPPQRVEVVDVTKILLERLRLDYDQIFSIGPESFELLVLDRLVAMGYEAQRVGGVYKKDGGIDIVFWPASSRGLPFVGAAQVKHHRAKYKREGPASLRELVGAAGGSLNFGVVVTNTIFTADAQWYARNHPTFLKLRDMNDLKNWIASEFRREREWKEMPEEIEIAPGVLVKIGPPRAMVFNPGTTPDVNSALRGRHR